MFCNFRKSFFPTEEEINKHEQWLKDNQLPKRSDIILIPIHNHLYVSKPFCNFEEQCTLCKNYWEDSYRHYIEGGWCNLHKCTCGWGFTCDDFKNK